MKRIKTYKLFESKLDVIYNVEDMLLELEDIGFNVSVSSPTDWLIELKIKKTISGSGKDAYKWSDIKEYVERVLDYLMSNGYTTSVSKENIGDTETFITISPFDFSTSGTTIFRILFTKDFKSEIEGYKSNK